MFTGVLILLDKENWGCVYMCSDESDLPILEDLFSKFYEQVLQHSNFKVFFDPHIIQYSLARSSQINI